LSALRGHLTLLGPLAAAIVLTAGCGGSANSGSSSLPTVSTVTTPVHPPARGSLISIFGDPSRLLTAPGPTLDTLRSLGVDYVRVTVSWAGVAPNSTSSAPPGGFDAASPGAYPASGWAPYDALIRDAQARGIGIDLDPGSPVPKWATGPGEPAGGLPFVWKPSAAAFGQFVRALGTRYSGSYTPPGAPSPLPGVHFWSVWNEPNYGPELAPQAIDHSTVEVAPGLYRGLLGAAWTALQQTGHGHDTILIGEIAPRGITTGDNPGNFSGMVPLRFVRALYCVDSSLHPLSGGAATARGCPATAAASKQFASQNPALFSASGFAVHPYPQGGVAPNVVTPQEPDYADFASLPRLEKLLDALQGDYGSSKRFDLYSTEFGYKTNPPFPAGAPLAQAAAYINWSEYLSWSDPRIRSYDQYLLADPPATVSRFDTGLEFVNGVPKPSLAAFRMPIFMPVTTAGAGTPLTVWGSVRPAHFAPGPQRVSIELGAGNKPFKVVDTVSITNPNGYFVASVRFPASGSVRLAWSYPHGPTIHSRPVTIAIR
jgi:hypothetical protein